MKLILNTLEITNQSVAGFYESQSQLSGKHLTNSRQETASCLTSMKIYGRKLDFTERNFVKILFYIT